ncbi:hypothetical protein GJ633_09380 [Halorubrum sp. CBA1125]|uniref:hypothetical protein n=1 Tax=Halorubrum sp. CBA1125 TaxID=2668072 RepID=UPI0012E89E7E|nr:hypothetical protein [Halorubrum sp. CBA1125]MUW14851.1 hypothetical protein [Halorubrum sp. CBA1125]
MSEDHPERADWPPQDAVERLQNDPETRELFEKIADADHQISPRFQRALELAGVREEGDE